MNYKVLYRKYRPTDFENVIGQDYTIKTLKNSIINGHISHAYIFSGPRGTGKTSTAKIFAKAINCSNPIDGSPCGNCEFCTNFKENPDIIEIDAASNNGVDEIRQLIDNVKLTPSNGKYKVYIIDEVHMLTQSAFNALLLTLEEPPSHVIFILATTNIENVPITILSRCQRFDFQKISVDDIVKNLTHICEKENIKADIDALKEIAYLSEGGMRDSLSLLDQLSKNDEKITLDFVEKEIRTVSKKNIEEIIDYIEENNVEKIILSIDEFKKRAIDYKTLIKKIIDVACTKAQNIKQGERPRRLDYVDYKNMIFNLSECLTKININVDPYIILKLTILDFTDVDDNYKMVEQKEKVDKKEISKEEIVEDKTEKTIKKDSYNELIDIRINNCFAEANKQELEEAKNNFEKLKTSIKTGKIKSILIDAIPVLASKKYIVFMTNNEHSALEANENLENIEKKFIKNIEKEYKIIFISEKRWNFEKNKYIENIKKGIKYNFIEENLKETKSEPSINDVFDINKVEVI